tara:strand:- start:1990 stop:2631 length:642 start_codon:yes stop_codon:yes gene_type:complete
VGLKFIIPAREGSKGMPHKNRTLVPIVINSIPKEHHEDVILTTDDEALIESVSDKKVQIRKRPKELASDKTSMKAVILDVVGACLVAEDDLLVVLYPTYPERTYKEINAALKFFHEHNLDSMLCKKEIKTHPFMCMVEKDDIYASELIKHPFYRRQDYPKCFEVCHYIIIMHTKEIKKLNNVLLNKKTGFHTIKNKIDVDYKKDYENFIKKGE